jgi:hypothetical protein
MNIKDVFTQVLSENKEFIDSEGNTIFMYDNKLWIYYKTGYLTLSDQSPWRINERPTVVDGKIEIFDKDGKYHHTDKFFKSEEERQEYLKSLVPPPPVEGSSDIERY